MMTRILMAALAACALAGLANAATVEIQDGNVVLKTGKRVDRLTNSKNDSDPVLSPDGTLVVFTRGTVSEDPTDGCRPDAKARAGLWSVRTDGKDERQLIKARSASEPRDQLCGFLNKQFTADGRQLYFESPAWVTSGAVHSYDLKTRRERFIAPSNSFYLVTSCEVPEYRNTLIVNQHRYLIGGGSYDWYWLLSADGRKELGPLGESTANFEDFCGITLPPA